MVQKFRQSTDIGLILFCSVLKSQSSRWSISKAIPNMVPTWSKHGPGMVPKSRHSIDIILKTTLNQYLKS